MRELHHRVSNHLQILASLIGLQARGHELPEVREALLEARRRILAVGRVNTEIQRSGTGDDVQLSPFLRRLRDDLRECFTSADDAAPALEFDIDDAVVSADRALTLALIVNELLTNAVKHAVLPHGGKVHVALHRGSTGEWRLTVQDEGPGFAHDPLAGSDHGFSMIRSLAAKLKGVVTIDPTDRGGAVSVAFF